MMKLVSTICCAGLLGGATACELAVSPDTLLWDNGGSLVSLKNTGDTPCAIDSLLLESDFIVPLSRFNLFNETGGFFREIALDTNTYRAHPEDSAKFRGLFPPMKGVTFDTGDAYVIGNYSFRVMKLPHAYDSVTWVTGTLHFHANGKDITLPYKFNRKTYNIFTLEPPPRRIPRLVEARALDNQVEAEGIDEDDQVLLRFDGPFWTDKTGGNLDSIFRPSSGHTWLSGFHSYKKMEISPDSTLVLISLDTRVSPPTLAVGDTITFAGDGSKAVLAGTFHAQDPVALATSIRSWVEGKGARRSDILGRTYKSEIHARTPLLRTDAGRRNK